MRTRIIACAIAVPICSAAIAQTTQSTDQRLNTFERRLNEIENKYKAELKQRDQEIARLKQQVPATQPADDIEKNRQDILQNIEAGESAPLTQRIAANFNPDFAVITNFTGNVSSDNANPARNRWD